MWDPKRKEWEEQYLLTQRTQEYMDSIAQQIAEFGITVTGKDVLDIGCGPGIQVHHLLSQGPRCIVGMDISPIYMTRVRDLEPGAVFAQGSADCLPFRDTSLDLVVFLGTLLHVKAKEALDEVLRVLRPGGYLWVSHILPGYYWWKIRYRSNRSLKKYAIETLSSIKRLGEPWLRVTGRVTYASRRHFVDMLSPLQIEKQVISRSPEGVACQIIVLARKPK